MIAPLREQGRLDKFLLPDDRDADAGRRGSDGPDGELTGRARPEVAAA
ncbi:hypothetical protein [Blastococcus brunescens]|uniref:Uncharacterized protein n=1 Tax=Blastococcus brunescens TaxID=1564165 RepID=A0ABZ1AYM8_9ACTN|nr:hypothetical protein [Blastococcus sp. BMG 8361]WRL63671.1 hypothetical protein U6N30_29075 [Blastococcus sp. BMG 8361]